MTDGDLELRVAWERHVGRSAAAAHWREAVSERYREPHRRYHDLRHLKWVVRLVGEFAAERPVADLGAIVVAAFFHDAVYVTARHDNEDIGNEDFSNEDISAHLARQALDELGWPSDRSANVERMIIGTIDHPAVGISLDDAVLFAADLGILAADPARYSEYVTGVRHEYAHVPDPAWVTGRSAVLRSFLDRDAIFAPMLGLEAWEQRARGNLLAELESLAA